MERILIIEDEKVLCENIKSALEMNNYEVHVADNGKTGLELAENVLPDLILCDIMMPNYDGYWVLENVRKHDELLTVPFIFITAKVERDDLRKGMDLGADDYLTKPFKIAELLKAIEVRIAKKRAYKSELAENPVKTAKIDKDNFVLLDTGKSIERIQINSVECILADNIYTQIFLTNKKFITVRKSLTEWEKLLPDDTFIRIHRAAIINLNFVKLIEKWFNQTMIIHMQNYEKPITMSRGYTSKLKGKFII